MYYFGIPFSDSSTKKKQRHLTLNWFIDSQTFLSLPHFPWLNFYTEFSGAVISWAHGSQSSEFCFAWKGKKKGWKWGWGGRKSYLTNSKYSSAHWLWSSISAAFLSLQETCACRWICKRTWVKSWYWFWDDVFIILYIWYVKTWLPQ